MGLPKPIRLGKNVEVSLEDIYMQKDYRTPKTTSALPTIIDENDPSIDIDKNVSLIYVGDFIEGIIKVIKNENEINLNKNLIYNYNVSDVLTKLNTFNDIYYKNNQIPSIDSHFDLCLFNTFRSYINYSSFFPKYHNENNK